jgi:hypothetical protein
MVIKRKLCRLKEKFWHFLIKDMNLFSEIHQGIDEGLAF